MLQLYTVGYISNFNLSLPSLKCPPQSKNVGLFTPLDAIWQYSSVFALCYFILEVILLDFGGYWRLFYVGGYSIEGYFILEVSSKIFAKLKINSSPKFPPNFQNFLRLGQFPPNLVHRFATFCQWAIGCCRVWVGWPVDGAFRLPSF